MAVLGEVTVRTCVCVREREAREQINRVTTVQKHTYMYHKERNY